VKKDTIATARRIGTYEISIRPGADCCGLLVARHPRTAATPGLLDRAEAKYAVDELVLAACEQRETLDFHPLRATEVRGAPQAPPETATTAPPTTPPTTES
jgi:hypothetical protein